MAINAQNRKNVPKIILQKKKQNILKNQQMDCLYNLFLWKQKNLNYLSILYK